MITGSSLQRLHSRKKVENCVKKIYSLMGVNPSEVCMSAPKILKYNINLEREGSENNIHYENEENRVCLLKLQAGYISCSTAEICNADLT